jgi:hypothetical protein
MLPWRMLRARQMFVIAMMLFWQIARDQNTQAKIPDLEVTNPAANDISQTIKTGKLVSR